MAERTFATDRRIFSLDPTASLYSCDCASFNFLLFGSLREEEQSLEILYSAPEGHQVRTHRTKFNIEIAINCRKILLIARLSPFIQRNKTRLAFSMVGFVDFLLTNGDVVATASGIQRRIAKHRKHINQIIARTGKQCQHTQKQDP